MLRALRLSHQLNFKIDKEVQRALLKLNKNISAISKERILDELMKMFSIGKMNCILKSLNDYGLFQYVFPQLALHLSHVNSKTFKNSGFQNKSFYRSDFETSDLFTQAVQKKSNPNENKRSSPQNPIVNSIKKSKSISIKQKYLKFWKGDFSFYFDSAFCWTIIGLPFFYLDSKSFDSFLQTYPIKTAMRKQAVFYLKSIQTLIDFKSSFTEKLLAFNGQKNQVYELTSNFLESKILKRKDLQKVKKNFSFIFKEFQKREIRGQLPPALVKGADLLKAPFAIEKKNFSKILKQAFIYQMENPKLNKTEILQKLGYK